MKSIKIKESIKKFWDFMNEDSWESTIVFLILALIFIKFIFMPFLAFVTGTKYNLVIVESCSMHHSKSLEEILSNDIYRENGIFFENTTNWNFKRGFTKGDIIFSISPKNIQVGDVIIFDSGEKNVRYPIIHRIIKIENNTITTKGDNNEGLLPYEKEIPRERVLAKSVARIPFVGWIKLIFFDWRKPKEQRGFC